MKLLSTLLFLLVFQSNLKGQDISVIVENSKLIAVSEIDLVISLATFPEEKMSQFQNQANNQNAIQLATNSQLLEFMNGLNLKYETHGQLFSTDALMQMPIELVLYRTTIDDSAKAQQFNEFFSTHQNVNASIIGFKAKKAEDQNNFYNELLDKAKEKASIIASSLNKTISSMTEVNELENEELLNSQASTFNLNDLIGWGNQKPTTQAIDFNNQVIYSKLECKFNTNSN